MVEELYESMGSLVTSISTRCNLDPRFFFFYCDRQIKGRNIQNFDALEWRPKKKKKDAFDALSSLHKMASKKVQ